VNTNGDGRAPWLVRIAGRWADSRRFLATKKERCVAANVNTLGKDELLHTGTAWLYSAVNGRRTR
jgi:hypothetical protein